MKIKSWHKKQSQPPHSPKYDDIRARETNRKHEWAQNLWGCLKIFQNPLMRPKHKYRGYSKNVLKILWNKKVGVILIFKTFSLNWKHKLKSLQDTGRSEKKGPSCYEKFSLRILWPFSTLFNQFNTPTNSMSAAGICTESTVCRMTAMKDEREEDVGFPDESTLTLQVCLRHCCSKFVYHLSRKTTFVCFAWQRWMTVWKWDRDGHMLAHSLALACCCVTEGLH